MFFQVTFTYDNGSIEDDIILERDSLKAAEWYAQHRAEDYGYEGNPVAKVKRISKAKAQRMFDGNAISWTNSLY